MTGQSTRVFSGLLWMLSSSAGMHVAGLWVNILLARLLSPGDFGAVALVMAFNGLLQVFAEMGLSVAIVQRKELPQTYVDSAFTGTLAFTLVALCLLWLSAGQVGAFFSIPVVKDLLRISAVSYFFRGLFAVYRCLLLREMRYRDISVIDFIGYAVYGSISTILALQGYGAFSMVWGQVAWSITLLLFGVWKTRYLPKSFGRRSEMWELISFGFWVSLSRVMRNVGGQADNFLIGKLLGAEALGIYHLAHKIVLLLPTAYTNVIDQVMFPVYAKMQDKLDAIEGNYWKVLSYTSLLVIPLVFLIFTFAKDLVMILYGPKWITAVPLIQIMSFFALARVLGDGIFDSVVFSIGRPQIVSMVNGFRLIVFPLFILIGCNWGIIGIAWGLAMYGLVSRIFHQFLLRHFLRFSFVQYLRVVCLPLAFAIVGTLGAHFALQGTWFPLDGLPVARVVAGTTIWLFLYVSLVWLFVKEKLREMLSLCRDVLRHSLSTGVLLRRPSNV